MSRRAPSMNVASASAIILRNAWPGLRSVSRSAGSALSVVIGGSVDARRGGRDDRVRQGSRDLDTDGAEHDASDPALGLGDAARIDGDDLVHECDEEREGADAPDEPLRDEDPVVDELL